MAEVSPHFTYFLLYCASSGGNWKVKVAPKVQTLSPPFFHNISDLSNMFQTMFLFARVLPLVKISTKLDHI